MTTTDRTLRTLTGYQLYRTTQVVLVRYNELLARFGLRRTTFSALRLIVDNPGLRSSQIADSLSMERPNLVQVVDELEERDLIRRTTDAHDRRAHALQPTSKGKGLAEQAQKAADALESELAQGLTEAQSQQLNELLRLIEQRAKTQEETDALKVSRA